MRFYKSKLGTLPGSSLEEVIKVARQEYHTIQKRTPRRIAHVRSVYFQKDKVFINNFWDHLNQKSPKERVKRLKFYLCAIDLLRNSKFPPESFQNPDNANEILHRFRGISADGYEFAVQVKDNKKTNRKDFMSVFPRRPSK